MTAAVLALAAAALISPHSPRRRIRALMPLSLMSPSLMSVPSMPVPPMSLSPHRRELRLLPFAVPAAAAAAWLLPLTAILSLGLLGATLLARRHLSNRRRVRIEAASALQSALDVLVAELRVGAHPVAAIGTAARESHGRVAQALGSVAARAVLGADVVAGLRVEAQRSTSPGYWERLAVCWHLAQTHGLAIASLMQAAQRDIVERERFRGRVAAGMAGARATAAILAGLPALGVLLGQSIGADPLGFLFSDGPGGWLLVVGSGLICCGLLWSDRITLKAIT